MDVKGKILLQLFNKSKLKNGTKTFLEPKFFHLVKFNKLRFSSSLIYVYWCFLFGNAWLCLFVVLCKVNVRAGFCQKMTFYQWFIVTSSSPHLHRAYLWAQEAPISSVRI